MNLYDAEKILRLQNQVIRCPPHVSNDAMPPLVDALAVAEAIDVVLSALHEASHASTQALRQVDQLQADLMDSDEIRDKMHCILNRTAAALKGDPPEGVWHSWHDLPEKAALAIRMADDAAESVICSEGRIERPGVWRITRKVFDADRAYLTDCIEHLRWRGLANAKTDAATGDVVVNFRGME